MAALGIVVQGGGGGGGDGGGGDGGGGPGTNADTTVIEFDFSVVPPLEHAPVAYTWYSNPGARGTVAGSFCKLVTLYAGVEVAAPVTLFTAVKTIEFTEQASFPPAVFSNISANPA
jgi:hypothetical protein